VAAGANGARLVAEYTIVGTAIVVLLRWRLGRALGARAAELGLAGWGGGRVNRRDVAAAVVLGLALAAVGWLATADYVAGWVTGVGAGLGVASLAVAAVVVARRRGGRAADAVFSYRLSAAPVMLLAAVVLAGVAGWPLTWAERRAVAAIENSPGAFHPTREVERSYWEPVRERIAGRAE
jgi:hypothetical protein